MLFENLKKEIEKRNQNLKRRTEIIGTEIKKRRIERNITQDKITQGKISVSYLSKIENGKIEPNEKYLKEILEEMQIDKNISNYFDIYLDLTNNMIKYFYLKDTKKVKDIYNKTLLYEFDMILIKFIYFIYMNDLDKALDFYEKLYQIRKSLSDYELLTALIFMCEYEYKIFNYDGSNKLRLIINDLTINNKYLKYLFDFITFKLSLIFKDYLNSNKNFIKIIDNSYHYCHFDLITEANNFYNLEILKNNNNIKNSINYFEEVVEKNNDIYFKYKFIMKDYIYIINNQKYCNTINKKMILLKSYFFTNNIEKIKEIFNMQKEYLYINSNAVDIYYLKYFELCITKNIFEMNKFLKKEAIPYFIENYNIDELNNFYFFLIENNYNDSKYKNCKLYEEKRKSIIEKIKYSYENY